MARSTTGIAYAFLYVAILGGLVFTVFVTIPSWSAWQATRAALAERTSARDERVRFLQNVDARLQELQTHEADARVLAVTFPENEAPADAVAIAGALAERNGLSVRVVTGPELRKDRGAPASTTQPRVSDELQEPSVALPRSAASRSPVYEFHIKVRGTYAGLSAFLRDLERSARFFDIPTLDIKGGFEGGLIEADLTVLTYVAEAGSTLLPKSTAASGTAESTPSPVPTPE